MDLPGTSVSEILIASSVYFNVYALKAIGIIYGARVTDRRQGRGLIVAFSSRNPLATVRGDTPRCDTPVPAANCTFVHFPGRPFVEGYHMWMGGGIRSRYNNNNNNNNNNDNA